MAKNPKKKTLFVLTVVLMVAVLGYLAYSYRGLLSRASENDVPVLPSSDALGSADITPFPSTDWTLVAYPFVASTTASPAPTYITARLSNISNDTGKDLATDLSQVYDKIYKLEKDNTSYVYYSDTDENNRFNTKPGSGYWVLVDEKDDKTPPDNLLDDYTPIINNSLKVFINSNAYTLIGNPYIDAEPLSKIKFTGKNINKTLAEAVNEHLVIIYTYNNDNFGNEFTKLTGSDSIEPNQGAAVITKVEEPALIFNKPDATS